MKPPFIEIYETFLMMANPWWTMEMDLTRTADATLEQQMFNKSCEGRFKSNLVSENIFLEFMISMVSFIFMNRFHQILFHS